MGFEVEAGSVQHAYKNRWDEVNPQLETCAPGGAHPLDDDPLPPPQRVAEGQEVIFTYDVAFRASDIRWASRWDTYLVMTDDSIHWFSIVNSLMIVLFLTGMLAMIMVRTLRRDISAYNDLGEAAAEEAAEESGWKMVHGDVFRPPRAAAHLSVAAGTGVQLLGMTGFTITFALLGFLSPANRGGLMTALLLLFVLMGTAAGYTSARLYKSFGLVRWRRMTLETALAFPSFCGTIFFVLNLLIWGQRSSGAVPFGTLIALASLWFGISVPLVFVGSYFGFRAPAPDAPVRTNKIPRQVPPQPWYMSPGLSVAVGGILPFGAVFIELFFILTSLWLHQVYYLFGILFLVFAILVVTCAEITVVLCYFQLCSEDYRWWWRAFFTSGSSAFYSRVGRPGGAAAGGVGGPPDVRPFPCPFPFPVPPCLRNKQCSSTACSTSTPNSPSPSGCPRSCISATVRVCRERDGVGMGLGMTQVAASIAPPPPPFKPQ